MKILFESKEEWVENKLLYTSSVGNLYQFNEEVDPISYPCIVVSTSHMDYNSYLSEHTVSFVYLEDFKRWLN
jgi:hypothetical protein